MRQRIPGNPQRDLAQDHNGESEPSKPGHFVIGEWVLVIIVIKVIIPFFLSPTSSFLRCRCLFCSHSLSPLNYFFPRRRLVPRHGSAWRCSHPCLPRDIPRGRPPTHWRSNRRCADVPEAISQ